MGSGQSKSKRRNSELHRQPPMQPHMLNSLLQTYDDSGNQISNSTLHSNFQHHPSFQGRISGQNYQQPQCYQQNIETQYSQRQQKYTEESIVQYQNTENSNQQIQQIQQIQQVQQIQQNQQIQQPSQQQLRQQIYRRAKSSPQSSRRSSSSTGRLIQLKHPKVLNRNLSLQHPADHRLLTQRMSIGTVNMGNSAGNSSMSSQSSTNGMLAPPIPVTSTRRDSTLYQAAALYHGSYSHPAASTTSDSSSRKTKSTRSGSIFSSKKVPKTEKRRDVERRLSKQAMTTFGMTEDDIRIWKVQQGKQQSVDNFSEQELEAIIKHYECLEIAMPVIKLDSGGGMTKQDDGDAGDNNGGDGKDDRDGDREEVHEMDHGIQGAIFEENEDQGDSGDGFDTSKLVNRDEQSDVLADLEATIFNLENDPNSIYQFPNQENYHDADQEAATED